MTPSRRRASTHRAGTTLRECSGLTTRLALVYVECEGGSGAVRRMLEVAGLADQEAELRDEHAWLPDEYRTRLFDAAAEVLGDPEAPRRMGESAIDLNTGQSLKLGLRALGSPRLLYANVVRANAKFNRVHEMGLLELGDDYARVTNAPIDGTPWHPSNCSYNVGLLSCAPQLWGEPLARVSHPSCIGRGDDVCVYEVSWTSPEQRTRHLLAWGGGAIVAVGAAAALAPAAVPFTIAGSAGAALFAAVTRSSRRRRLLENEVRQERDSTELLMGSLHDLVSALRLDDVLERITVNARAAVGGTEFALLLEEPDGLRCQGSPGLPVALGADLAAWAENFRRPLEQQYVIDDLAGVDALASLRNHPELQAGSLCSVPLGEGSGPVGALIAVAGVRRAFLPRDISLIRSYANQAAIAIANARLYEAQEALAIRDPLTGLFNHREFHERLSGELERCRRYGGEVSIVMLDLDNFKQVNDTGGHAEGDRVLRGVARAMEKVGRGPDLAFRIGGDELAAILPGTGRQAAEVIAARLRDEMAGVDPRVGVSLGIAGWPESGPSKDAILAHADSELYADKHRPAAQLRGSGPSLDAGRTSGRGRAPGARAGRHLEVARHLALTLAPVREPAEIARIAVSALQESLDIPLVMISLLETPDRVKPIVGAGPLWDQLSEPDSWRLGLGEGVMGRAAKTGEPALITDTRNIPDFIASEEIPEPRSELAVPIRVRGEVWGVLNIEDVEPWAFDAEDLGFTDMIAAQVGVAIHRALMFEELEETFMATIAVLSDALEATDAYTAEHARGVAELAEQVGVRLGMRGVDLRDLRYGALLHDIGKIAVPTEVLTKPGPLDPSELAEMRRHAAVGAELLEQIPAFASVHPLVRASHERWDGGGYPDGLREQEIPLGARIISACDAFHAMTSDRPYRDAMPIEVALGELRLHAGRQFDGSVVAVLLELVNERDEASQPA